MIFISTDDALKSRSKLFVLFVAYIWINSVITRPATIESLKTIGTEETAKNDTVSTTEAIIFVICAVNCSML